jgi:hypothetical protein
MRRPTMSGSRIFFLWLSGLALAAHAQPRFLPQPDYSHVGTPDQAEGRRVLEDFRAKGIAGDYYLEFELHVLPRRGDERVLTGQLWGTRNDQGPLSRLAVTTDTKSELYLLVQNGFSPKVWVEEDFGGDVTSVEGVNALFETIGNTNLRAFDLQMPFLYWPDFKYEGITRMRGRPAYQFLMHAPKEYALRFSEKRAALSDVRIYLDTQFNALVQAELLDTGGQVGKTISLLELKHIGDQWIPKTIDVRDEVTRDKTRFVVKGAALSLTLPREIFAWTNLMKKVNPPDAQKIVPVE